MSFHLVSPGLAGLWQRIAPILQYAEAAAMLVAFASVGVTALILTWTNRAGCYGAQEFGS
jgi:hypothetical protein